MDTLIGLTLSFATAVLAGLGASLSKERALPRRILIGRMLVSGMAGLAAFAMYVERFEVAQENYWKYLWVSVVAGYAGPQAMNSMRKTSGMGDDTQVDTKRR